MAFVVIQHLDPTQKGMMPELLQRAIKEKAGVVLVQDLATAQFDSMPRSAVEAGLADIIGPVDELPGKLIAYGRHIPQLTKSEQPLDEKIQSALDKIVILLRTRTGHDFTLYRRSTLHRRVERRMGIHQLTKIEIYIHYVQENPHELGIPFKELLIGVTTFFRDPAAWQQLAKLALPAQLAARPAGGVVRAWVAGCSTGEEAYTLAMGVTMRGIKLGIDAEARAVDLTIEALTEPKELSGMVLIMFTDTVAPVETQSPGARGKASGSNAARREMEQALQRALKEVQAGREEMQTSHEELKSMNEELQSTNEELQIVNAELQTKLDELSAANNDMKNLINSTDIATVFLHNELRVRRFTLQAKTIIKFTPSDVGRPITDLASDLLYPDLVTDAHEVLRTLVFCERTIATHDRSLVHGARHALPHDGQPDQRRGHHLLGHHLRQKSGEHPAREKQRSHHPLGEEGPRVASRRPAFAPQNDTQNGRRRRKTQVIKKPVTHPESAGALRLRAEQRLHRKPAKVSLSAAHADTHRLLQELQIHQIELELQNEHLKQAKDEVGASLEKFADLYDFSPSDYFTLAADGTIQLVNLTGATLLGIERLGCWAGPLVISWPSIVASPLRYSPRRTLRTRPGTRRNLIYWAPARRP